MFPTVAASFYIPTGDYKGSNYSTSLPTIVIFYFLNYSHSSGCEVVSHVVLICIFLMTNDVGYLFMCSLPICVSFLEKCLFKFIAH